MNLFELCLKFNHREKKDGWKNTRAVFTGRSREAVGSGFGSKRGYYVEPHLEYEIRYYAGDKTVHSWYVFYPLPDPYAEELAGMEIEIKYKEKKPYIYECVSSED